jgi:hypothetical protein
MPGGWAGAAYARIWAQKMAALSGCRFFVDL